MANPFFIQSESVAPQLAGLGQLIGQYGQQQRQQQTQEQQQLQQQQLGERASQLFETGTPEEIAEFSLKNPNMGKLLSQQIAFRSDATKENMMQGMRDIILNPNDAERILTERAAMVAAEGGDPSHTIAEIEKYKQDPTGYAANVEKAYSMMDPAGYRQYAATKPEPMTEYQRATVEGKRRDQELRQAEAENKRDENRLKRETDDLKRQELQQRIQDRTAKTQAAKEQMVSTARGVVDQGQAVLDLIGNIEQHPGLSSAVGAKGATSAFGLLDEPIAGTEAAGAKALIDTLEAKNFLTAIGQFKSAGGAGALSDAEGRRLSAAISSLSRDQSEADFKKSLSTIRNLVNKQVSSARKQAGPETPRKNLVEADQGSIQTGNFSSLWGG